MALVFSTGLLANDFDVVKEAIAQNDSKKVQRLLEEGSFSESEIKELKEIALAQLSRDFKQTTAGREYILFFSSALSLSCLINLYQNVIAEPFRQDGKAVAFFTVILLMTAVDPFFTWLGYRDCKEDLAINKQLSCYSQR